MAAAIKRWLRRGAMLAPHGLWLLAQKLIAHQEARPVPWELLRRNERLANSKSGKRCFILGNGPSVKELDLARLQGEIVFSVSNGYLHQNYADIKPEIHCVPQISYGRMTERDVIEWFEEMHKRIGEAVLFLSDTEADLVCRHKLFPGREVHYLSFRDSFDDRLGTSLIDLSKPTPRIESVPIMALMLAMYMGIKEIYLLGVDHDHFKTGSYQYAFNLGVQEGKDVTVNPDGTIVWSRYDDFQSLARLWRQYRSLHKIAKHHGICIFNATPGGELDEFPRVDFNQLMEGKV